MMAHFRRAAARLFGVASLPVSTALLALSLSAPARADVDVRVEARPASAPIEVFVSVTNAGAPVGGLDFTDFTVTIDGDPITIGSGDLTLPPAQNPNQFVSVVFTMDYSPSVVDTAIEDLEAAVIAFANLMRDGDQVAIVKFNDTNPAGASVVLPFTTIDHGANNDAIAAAVEADYPGVGTNLLDALVVSLNHILTPPSPLPDGPKSIVLVSDGGELNSEATLSDVLQLANDNSIPIFTIGVADISEPGFTELLESLAGETGGDFFPAPDDTAIGEAYGAIFTSLNNEYLLTIANGITDCAEHELAVTVTGQATVTVPFTRRTCDTEPNPFTFTAQTGVNPSTTVTSDPVTITGIETGVSAHVSVLDGRYSIGCTDTFTTGPGAILDGETVCVRQQSSSEFSTARTTTLTIGGVAGTFTTTTRAGSTGGGGGGGGGGAMGLFELLLGLAMLAIGRRRCA